MTNAYADLTTLKSAGVLNISGTKYDSRLRELLEAVSRLIDRHCNRRFWVLDATRRFDGDGTGSLLVPDLVSVASLETDDDGDRVFETAWAASDYLLYPSNADPTKPWGRPYGQVVAAPGSGGKDVFTKGRQTVRIQGKWGFRDVTEDSGAGIEQGSPVSPSDTVLKASDGSKLAAGQTLLLGSEQVYVTAVDGNDLTVQRGVNGTVAAAHAGGAGIRVYSYPEEVVEACLLQTARLWNGRGGSLPGTPGPSDASLGLDRDVRRLLSAYRKPAMGGGA